jgi:hypothetical protein
VHQGQCKVDTERQHRVEHRVATRQKISVRQKQRFSTQAWGNKLQFQQKRDSASLTSNVKHGMAQNQTKTCLHSGIQLRSNIKRQ